MSEKYQPKNGDRVRVVLEGVASVDSLGGACIGVEYSNYIHLSADHVVSVEKLADPEPEWVHGAVVQEYGFLPAVYDKRTNTWRSPSGGAPHSRFTLGVSGAWQRGTLKVLWNGDE